jgi:hypothetical protein
MITKKVSTTYLTVRKSADELWKGFHGTTNRGFNKQDFSALFHSNASIWSISCLNTYQMAYQNLQYFAVSHFQNEKLQTVVFLLVQIPEWREQKTRIN